MQDLTKPRKKKWELTDIKNSKQRELARILREVMEENSLTSVQFAESFPPVSIATINKTAFSDKEYIPTPRIIKLLANKIANIKKGNAEQEYQKLMEAAGFDLDEYPFEDTPKKSPNNSNSSILLSFVESISKLPITFSGELKTNYCIYNYFDISEDEHSIPNYILSGGHELILDYSKNPQAPVDYWAIDVIKKNDGNRFRNILFQILMEGNAKHSNSKVKYSVIVDDLGFFNYLKAFELVNLHNYISIILYDGKTFSETYFCTGNNPTMQEIEGLTLNS